MIQVIDTGQNTVFDPSEVLAELTIAGRKNNSIEKL